MLSFVSISFNKDFYYKSSKFLIDFTQLIKDLDEKMEKAVPNGGSTGQVLTKKSNKDKDAIWQNPGVSEEQINTSVNKYLEKNPVQPTSIDETLTKEGEAADAKVTGEKIEKKANNSGWDAERLIGTDVNGNMIDLDASQVDIKNLVFKSDDEKRYAISINSEGVIETKEWYKVPENGLIVDLQVKDGVVTNTVSGETISDYTVDEDYFKPSKSHQLIPEGFSADSFTIICIPFLNTRSWSNGYKPFFQAGSGYNPMNIGYEKNLERLVIYDCSGFSKNSWTDFFWPVAFLDPERNVCVDNNDLFLGFSKDSDKNTYTRCVNNNISVVEANTRALTYLMCTSTFKYKRVMIYNRALTNPELISIYKLSQAALYEDLYYQSRKLLQGLVGLGSPTAFQRKYPNMYCEYFDVDKTVGEHTFTSQSGDLFTFENVPLENPVIDTSTQQYEEVIFINPISSMTVGDMYALEAMPYPYNVKQDSYNIEYTSSNSEIVECYQGVLIAKSEGNVIITAKISNSTITCEISIEVEKAIEVDKNMCYIPDNYCYGVHALNSKNPVSVANAIRGAIYESKEQGYDGVVFPTKEYNVKFSDYDENGIFIQMPSDFIIDFNNSVFLVSPRDDTKEKGICLFAFGNLVTTSGSGYNDWVLCENSEIKNLQFYGERYTTEYSSEQDFKGSNFVRFEPSSRNCKLYNIHTEGTTGWIIDGRCSDYNYWTGTGRRGRTYYNDYVAGRLDETGTEVVEDSTGTWYCTPEYLELGYVYGKDSIKTNEMDKYVFGFMGIVTYGNAGRWYDIYFFDENKQLISYNQKQFGLEPYQLPENAVYFKVNVPFGEKPTKDSGEDTCVVRLYPYMEPTGHIIEKCTFVNPQYTCLSMTGGVGFIIKDVYVENGVIANWMWAIDWEDGWQAMRHNIHYNVLCFGHFYQPGGHHCCILNSVISGMLNINNDTESTITLNSAIKTINLKSKTNEFIQNVHYRTFNKTQGVANVSTIQDINNTQLDSWLFTNQ